MPNTPEITYTTQLNPNIKELEYFLEIAFDSLTPEDQKNFDEAGNGQNLREWFGIDSLAEYLKYCTLIEARTIEGKLIGTVIIGKQNPLTWPDGNKIEMFALAVDPAIRGLGIGSTLVKQAETACKNMSGKKLILNTHIMLTADHKFYEKLGFIKMGILKDYYGNGDAVFYFKDIK